MVPPSQLVAIRGAKRQPGRPSSRATVEREGEGRLAFTKIVERGKGLRSSPADLEGFYRTTWFSGTKHSLVLDDESRLKLS